MSQTGDVLDHMREFGSITPQQALSMYGCMRLASRIDELRNEGHYIKTTMRKAGKERWAEYRLFTPEEIAEIDKDATTWLRG